MFYIGLFCGGRDGEQGRSTPRFCELAPGFRFIFGEGNGCFNNGQGMGSWNGLKPLVETL